LSQDEEMLDTQVDGIASTDQRLSDIALAVGFSDQSHLARQFSRLVGSTPSAFRRAQR